MPNKLFDILIKTKTGAPSNHVNTCIATHRAGARYQTHFHYNKD